MITEPISFTGRLTLEDTLDLNRFYFRCILRPTIRVLLGTFSLLIATLITFFSIETHFTGFSFCVLALCMYFPFGWLIHQRLAVARRYRRHPEQFIESTVTFTNESVSISNLHMDMRLNWDRLGAIVSTPRGLLFLTPPHSALFWLPQRLFDGNNYKDTVEELATEHKILIRRMA